LYLTTQRDTVVTIFDASQTHITCHLKNTNRNIFNCSGNILYHKWYNEIRLVSTDVKIKVASTSPASLFTNRKYEREE
jgi:hypothetical protein